MSELWQILLCAVFVGQLILVIHVISGGNWD